ncbi:hypothetical protein ES332_D01G207000v1 [Gossypium tomentosum]|uniref:Uncharacterized protein n=1 Tax=Gossypium tomentosum TaxID=34277 RepID=A0A5D2MBD4_GOSTO|nr:hypothetical protein ES332_D01G207000v1 [Gossypium tomentosum]
MKLNLVERRWGIDEGRQTEVAIFTLIKVLCLNQQNPLGDLSVLRESCISRRHTYNQHQESQFVNTFLFVYPFFLNDTAIERIK